MKMVSFQGKLTFSLLAIVALAIISVNCHRHRFDARRAFTSAQLVPDLISRPPIHLLKVTYANNTAVIPGRELTPTQVASEPVIQYPVRRNSYHTIVMLDPDAPSRAEPTFRSIKHWMVVNIPGSNISEGEIIASYAGSMPGEGSGLHRYTILLYNQPGKIAFTEAENRFQFNITAFAQEYKLGPPLAGNYFQSQYQA